MKEDVTLEHLQNLNKPIWCGETGHLANHTLSYRALVEFLHLLDSYSISWSLWPYKDIGSMGLIGLPENSTWLKMTQALSNNWNFWKIFTRDSLVSAQMKKNKYLYYQQLACETTKAHKVFAANIDASHAQTLTEAVQDFRFDKSLVTEHYKIILSEIMNM